jgi:uncharacterized protein YeeX (DUF496 family)
MEDWSEFDKLMAKINQQFVDINKQIADINQTLRDKQKELQIINNLN